MKIVLKSHNHGPNIIKLWHQNQKKSKDFQVLKANLKRGKGVFRRSVQGEYLRENIYKRIFRRYLQENIYEIFTRRIFTRYLQGGYLRNIYKENIYRENI